ncbi:MAG: hypothetical protein MI757_02455 [Pirellulales bacterium]|nr:hypothetical protein [Pirellulales bacterium]
MFLHDVLDLWSHQWRKSARGDVIIVRYADDFVLGFQHEDEAKCFLSELRDRLKEFGFELHPEKTRLIEFGRFAIEDRADRGEGRPETFDFLGFTHICGKIRKGNRFTIHRKTIAKRMRSKLLAIKIELRKRMHASLGSVGQWLRSVMQGWFNYHAVPGNYRRLDQFATAVEKLWLAAIRRRSQSGRNRWPWQRFVRLRERWIPRPRIKHPYPSQRLRVTTQGRSRMR